MISQKDSKQVSMDCWLLKLLSRDMKTKTKNKNQTTNNHKKNRKIIPWTTIPEMDRWEIPILNLVCHVNPGNE